MHQLILFVFLNLDLPPSEVATVESLEASFRIRSQGRFRNEKDILSLIRWNLAVYI